MKHTLAYGTVEGRLLRVHVNDDGHAADMLQWGEGKVWLGNMLPWKLRRLIPPYWTDESVSGDDWVGFVTLAVAMGVLK